MKSLCLCLKVWPVLSSTPPSQISYGFLCPASLWGSAQVMVWVLASLQCIAFPFPPFLLWHPLSWKRGVVSGMESQQDAWGGLRSTGTGFHGRFSQVSAWPASMECHCRWAARRLHTPQGSYRHESHARPPNVGGTSVHSVWSRGGFIRDVLLVLDE